MKYSPPGLAFQYLTKRSLTMIEVAIAAFKAVGPAGMTQRQVLNLALSNNT